MVTLCTVLPLLAVTLCGLGHHRWAPPGPLLLHWRWPQWRGCTLTAQTLPLLCTVSGRCGRGENRPEAGPILMNGLLVAEDIGKPRPGQSIWGHKAKPRQRSLQEIELVPERHQLFAGLEPRTLCQGLGAGLQSFTM